MNKTLTILGLSAVVVLGTLIGQVGMRMIAQAINASDETEAPVAEEVSNG